MQLRNLGLAGSRATWRDAKAAIGSPIEARRHEPSGVFDHGMLAKGDPVTWQSHTILREIPVRQGTGDQSLTDVDACADASNDVAVLSGTATEVSASE